MKRVQGKKKGFPGLESRTACNPKVQKNLSKKKEKKKVTLRAEKRSFNGRNRYKVTGKKNLH